MTEAEVLSSLEALHGRTVIVIAHRLSTTRMADQIVVLAGGRVVEAGAPAALYESDGLFSKMVKLQELTHIISGSKQG
jgi:ABC-type multidrug transport system fused ATPase/permease subunit